MFDNIIGQTDAVGALTSMIDSQKIPHSMLFCGPAYGARLTTALEFARSLMCREGSAAWDCECLSCGRNRLLLHPNTKLLGRRSFLDEVRASGDVFGRTPSLASRFLYFRSVRKLLRRFDPELWDPRDTRYRKVARHIDELNEALDSLTQSEAEATSTDLVIEQCERIVKSMPADLLPVDLIRRVASWVHVSTDDAAKVIIICGAELMRDTPRNALLKLLEEPPTDTYFVLIAPRAESLIPTIRSRLRPVYFRDRSAEEHRTVLKRVFKDDSGDYRDVAEYFLAFQLSPDAARNESIRFLDAVASRSPEQFFDSGEDVALIIDRNELLESFLRSLLEVAGNKMRDEPTGREDSTDAITLLTRYQKLVSETHFRVTSLNANPRNALEALFYEMSSLPRSR